MGGKRVVVVGGGVGGYAAALRAARLGAEVVLVEKDRIGGVCLNRGCIPTKVLLHSAWLYTEMKRASLFGLSVGEPRVDFSKLLERKKAVVARLTGGVASLLKSKRVRVVNGTAVFVDSRSIRIRETGEAIAGDKFILATGSVPARLSIDGSDKVPLLTSDDLLNMETLPSSLLIIGGGYIGVELGQFYGRMGVNVTMVEKLDRIIPTEDEEIGAALKASLTGEGIKIFTNASVEKVRMEGRDRKIVVATAEGKKEIVAAQVVQTVGRRPHFAELDIDRAGLKTEGGRIAVNGGMQTNIPHIYAVGDVTGGIMLAHVAMAEAECAALNAMGHHASVSCRAVPRCIYTSPEVGCVGLTEKKAAEEKGCEVQVSRFPLHAVGKALLMDEAEGMIKIVADKRYGEVLGVHIIGAHATELIAEAVLAMDLEATVEELAHAIHPHPTLSEAMGEAAMMLSGGALHLP